MLDEIQRLQIEGGGANMGKKFKLKSTVLDRVYIGVKKESPLANLL